MKPIALPVVVAASLLAGGCALIDHTTQADSQTAADCAPVAAQNSEEPVATAPRQAGTPTGWSQCASVCENMVAASVRMAKAECATPVNENESLLAYYGRLHKLAGPELTTEHESVRQLYARSRSDAVRVRYAMLLSIPGTPFSNESRALETLRPVVANPASSLHALALLVNSQVEAQRREQELSQKLDALKSLDKSLIERRLY